jgi:hypothetical protein
VRERTIVVRSVQSGHPVAIGPVPAVLVGAPGSWAHCTAIRGRSETVEVGKTGVLESSDAVGEICRSSWLLLLLLLLVWKVAVETLLAHILDAV